jgi:hypothetical protein
MPIQFKSEPTEYRPVRIDKTVCGGNAPESKDVQARALEAAMHDMEDDPCGCEVCFANRILNNLRRLRREAGLDPDTGNLIK